jgi:predicted site-specific integrase-resolvase
LLAHAVSAPRRVRQTIVERSRPETLTFDGSPDNVVSGQRGFRTGAKVGYARVSAFDQDTGLQLDALPAAGCAKVFEDHASGARVDRAGLRQALDYVRDGDVHGMEA